MTGITDQWLTGRRALLVGSGAAVEAVANAIERAGASLVRAAAAVVDSAAITALFEGQGSFDLLVHAGTPLADNAPQAIDLAQWRESFSADLDGRYLFAAEFARRIIGSADRHGAILFLMPGYRPEAGRGAASAAHGALDNLVKSLAVEWARDGIRVNGIASRCVETFAERPAAERLSLAHLACWLLSDYAAYMTGAISGIDEGLIG